jgi:hypothetical protein
MVDLDDLNGPMKANDNLNTALGTETLADRDMVTPWLRQHPGSSADNRDFRAPEVPEGEAQCHLALWTKGIQGQGPWDRISSARHAATRQILEMQPLQ